MQVSDSEWVLQYKDNRGERGIYCTTALVLGGLE
jgi:hypothetical protein